MLNLYESRLISKGVFLIYIDFQIFSLLYKYWDMRIEYWNSPFNCEINMSLVLHSIILSALISPLDLFFDKWYNQRKNVYERA